MVYHDGLNFYCCCYCYSVSLNLFSLVFGDRIRSVPLYNYPICASSSFNIESAAIWWFFFLHGYFLEIYYINIIVRNWLLANEATKKKHYNLTMFVFVSQTISRKSFHEPISFRLCDCHLVILCRLHSVRFIHFICGYISFGLISNLIMSEIGSNVFVLLMRAIESMVAFATDLIP